MQNSWFRKFLFWPDTLIVFWTKICFFSKCFSRSSTKGEHVLIPNSIFMIIQCVTNLPSHDIHFPWLFLFWIPIKSREQWNVISDQRRRENGNWGRLDFLHSIVFPFYSFYFYFIEGREPCESWTEFQSNIKEVRMTWFPTFLGLS